MEPLHSAEKGGIAGSDDSLTPQQYLANLEDDAVRSRTASALESYRRAVITTVGLSAGTVVYGVALYFGLFWWTLLASLVYWIFGGIILPAAFRRLGVINRRRTDLMAAILGLLPAAALLWPPLSATGFHPHGSWSFLCWILSSGASCAG